MLTPPVEISQKHPSMRGPGNSEILALEVGSQGLGWLTGFRSRLVSAEDESEVSQEYHCHTNLVFPDPKRHIQAIKPFRIFTISQGLKEMTLPAGFGVPVQLDTPMRVDTQVLNLNEVLETPLKVRHQTTVQFVPHRELKEPLIPLSVINCSVLRPLEPGSEVSEQGEVVLKGGGCGFVRSGVTIVEDPEGNKSAAHWSLGQGREESRTDITWQLSLSADTTLHYAFAHVHPFCESIELRDLTEGVSLLKLETRQSSGKIGLSSVDHFSSQEGLPLLKDHRYELVSVYNNTSDEPQDAMADLFVFLRDNKFEARLQRK